MLPTYRASHLSEWKTHHSASPLWAGSLLRLGEDPPTLAMHSFSIFPVCSTVPDME